MPSKSLVSSWTASGVSPGSHVPPASHRPCPRNLPIISHTRLPVLRHLHGLWEGVSLPRKIRRASSTISIQGTMLVSTVTPTLSPVTFPPSSPTTPTPAYVPRGVDTDRPSITTVETEARSRFSQPFNHDGLSPVDPTGRGAQLEPSPVPCTQPGPISNDSPLSCMRPSSQAPCAPVSVVLDAATRLQDFRTLIADMRAALSHHYDFEEGSDSVNCDHDDDEEKERLLQLLEDVMRKVKHLAEQDARVSSVQCSLGLLPPYQMFPSYYPMN